MSAREAWELRAGAVSRTRGAWLVVVHDPEGEAVPDDEFTCAAALPVAKRVAVETARGWGYGGAHRWTYNGTSWVLDFARYDPEDR